MDPCGYKSIRSLAFPVLAALLASAPALSQAPCPTVHSGPRAVHYFQLKNAVQQDQANEIMIALRNMLDPNVKLYLLNSEDTIVMEAAPEQIDMAQSLISELDRPRKLFRLTFTLADLDGGRTVAVRHATMIVAAGQRTTLKQGNRVPLMTTIFDRASASPEKPQPNYIDVGLSLDATVAETGSGLSLKSKVEQSTLGSDTLPTAPQEPVVHQAVLEGTSSVPLGKTTTLGTIDLPDSTHRLQIEVTADPVS